MNRSNERIMKLQHMVAAYKIIRLLLPGVMMNLVFLCLLLLFEFLLTHLMDRMHLLLEFVGSSPTRRSTTTDRFTIRIKHGLVVRRYFLSVFGGRGGLWRTRTYVL